MERSQNEMTTHLKVTIASTKANKKIPVIKPRLKENQSSSAVLGAKLSHSAAASPMAGRSRTLSAFQARAQLDPPANPEEIARIRTFRAAQPSQENILGHICAGARVPILYGL